MLPLEKIKINIPLKESEIDPKGLEEIEKILNKSGIFLNFSYLIERISPDWVVSKGEFTGTFPKRFAKICKQWKITLDNRILGDIGNIARKYTLNREYFIEFSKNLNWTPGEFGDKNSCFFGIYKYQRTKIKLLGGYAMKVYDESQSPLGRAWVLPYDEKEKNFLVFNSYNTRNYNLIFFARLLAIYLGGIYEMITGNIPNIYTNNKHFYFITTEGVEFSWAELWRYIESNLIICPTCGESHPILDLKTYLNDTKLYCPSCGTTLAGEEDVQY